MHLFQLWPVDWVKHMVKINQVVGEKNRLDASVVRKQPVRHFTRNKFWECIGYIPSSVTFGVKGN